MIKDSDRLWRARRVILNPGHYLEAPLKWGVEDVPGWQREKRGLKEGNREEGENGKEERGVKEGGMEGSDLRKGERERWKK